MDQFERELARLMRDSRRDTPYEDRHRRRLRAAVRARRRTRAAWMATGSLLTAAALGAVLVVLAGTVARGGPAGPRPRPVTSAASLPATATATAAATITPSPQVSDRGRE
ncbi:hypothetical protein [Streptomyces sp. NPDC088812]|uniref:hypothetical protein n=1 Tax=Streptomyces sp. NPDC088812 TaxID=3365905 RepID=UPI003823BA49